MRIALIEDDETISYAISTYMNRHNIMVNCFESLALAKDLDVSTYDLIILDVNLPDGSGFDYLKNLRKISKIPVIMLTVKNEEHYVVKGFEDGADDYITKPFSLPVLKARVDNILKRRKSLNEVIVFEKLTLNSTMKTATLNGQTLNLNRQEFEVLYILVENKGINVPRERLIDLVWGYDLYEVNDNTLTVTIKRLRNKLNEYASCIKTVRGIGYVWKDQ